jgi:hypothetical protein
MAASFVLQGALNEELFLQPGCSGEMFFIFAKLYPFLKEFIPRPFPTSRKWPLDRRPPASDWSAF